MSYRKIPSPYKSEVKAVREETKYVPACAAPETVQNFTAASTREKQAACSACLVRIECCIDGVNERLTIGSRPHRSMFSGMRAGVSGNDLTEFAAECYDNGIQRIGVDEAEAYLASRNNC